MYSETLYPETSKVLSKLAKYSLMKGFYLAGGTGLALQLGHRKSIDLDFFSSIFPRNDLLLQKLSDLKPQVLSESEGTLDLSIDGVKVSFLEYNYRLLQGLINYEEVRVASILDIACMKITAISSRGSRKDFVDLYSIFSKYSLKEILNNFMKKYQNISYNKVHILKSLTYFKEADEEPELDYIVKTNWEEVKERVCEEVKKLISW